MIKNDNTATLLLIEQKRYYGAKNQCVCSSSKKAEHCCMLQHHHRHQFFYRPRDWYASRLKKIAAKPKDARTSSENTPSDWSLFYSSFLDVVVKEWKRRLDIVVVEGAVAMLMFMIDRNSSFVTGCSAGAVAITSSGCRKQQDVNLDQRLQRRCSMRLTRLDSISSRAFV
jgi:hypothetical protein